MPSTLSLRWLLFILVIVFSFFCKSISFAGIHPQSHVPTLPSGDANGDGTVTVADLFYLIHHLFTGGPPPVGRGDTNGDGVMTVADAIYLVNHLFAEGPPPAVATGRYRLPLRGLWVQMERRGWPSEYWTGQLVRDLQNFDSVVGSTVQAEAALQLDRMVEMGVNTVTLELRATDPVAGSFVFPECNMHPALGFPWPQPTQTELTNLRLLFDLVHSKGIKIFLVLNNTHMEEQPPTNNQTWLSAILNAIRDHPALEVILFGGNERHVDSNGDGLKDACGIPAEPPLWMGPGYVTSQYLKWAINLARSLGLPARKSSAEAIAADYFLESEPANSFATDGHLWSPIRALKQIFDQLGIPDSHRTYAISLFEDRKCSRARGLPCTDADPHSWADESFRKIVSLVGPAARIVAPEIGLATGADPTWRTEYAVESLVSLMETFGLAGGTFWRWASFETSEDSNPSLSQPVKRRGTAFVFNPVANEIIDLGGLHLFSIPNGSFEAGTSSALNWTVGGDGSAVRYDLSTEPGQPEVPVRGRFALRLSTGANASSTILAQSDFIASTPEVIYTTTANLRFGWSGDPNPGAAAASRPHVAVRVQYFDQNQQPIASRVEDVFRYFQENSTSGFDTFALRYTTPIGTSFVRIVLFAARNNLSTGIILDVDAVR